MNHSIGIIGGGGYTAGELLRLLEHHPRVSIGFVQSSSQAGKLVSDVHQDLQLSQFFVATPDVEVDVLFLCSGHGRSREFLKAHPQSASTKIIDLSSDFRWSESDKMPSEFLYGLPEFQREIIQKAQYVANPGCFATAIQLALLPLATAGLLTHEVHINATTGATGAGQEPSATSHFPWRSQNVSIYKPFVHQHLGEIRQTLEKLLPETVPPLHFIPQRGNFSRGIFATAYTDFEESLEAAQDLYSSYYKDHPFTVVRSQSVALKQVVNTNYCYLHLQKHEHYLLITSALDNLLKGASGQAVENMNLMMGWEQSLGLRLKASSF